MKYCRDCKFFSGIDSMYKNFLGIKHFNFTCSRFPPVFVLGTVEGQLSAGFGPPVIMENTTSCGEFVQRLEVIR